MVFVSPVWLERSEQCRIGFTCPVQCESVWLIVVSPKRHWFKPLWQKRALYQINHKSACLEALQAFWTEKMPKYVHKEE